ncbi:MAG: sugar nucleotide-binding protein [Porticoccus sp.]|nr:sugar nucleotide-binding protein [Porticoccus sp.]
MKKSLLKVLFIGCGDIGVRTIQRLECSQDGLVWQALAMRRHPERLSPNISSVAVDLKDTEALAGLLASRCFDAIVVTLTADQMTDQGYVDTYVAGAQALQSAIVQSGQSPGLVIWVSSTGVYHQSNGEWVDELSETNPSSFRGKRLLEAEQVIQQLAAPSVVVRFSGIYGPGRSRLISQVRQGAIAAAVPVHWTNRIHSEDCAGVLTHLLNRCGQGEALENLYLATDNEPAPAHEMQRWLAEQVGVEPLETSEARRMGNRRCSNQRLRTSGYLFCYPTYREGYGALLADS